MPEGHLIHRIARDHTRDFGGRVLHAESPQGRFAKEAKLINGLALTGVEAYGKHLCYRWTDGKNVHVHLGLYGKFRTFDMPAPPPQGAVRWRITGESKGFDLNGPNQCELISDDKWDAICARLGPDPLRSDGDGELAWERISKSAVPIGTLLLNQAVIAGVGNVYRSEVLFLLGIHPETSGRSIGRENFDRLWSELRRLLKIGMQYNRIIVADPADVGKTRGRMTRDERLLVYKRPRCGNCDREIVAWELGGRKAYACNGCQQ
ncbi:MAG: hypothetical protein KDA61_15055 [Planctomycetales bacterium]|nr:hypothetical protein [Planctomycetales bacterium]